MRFESTINSTIPGMPDVELGINDMWRQGKEVVGRHDIIPVVTEEWIRLENVEFHSCVQQDEYEKSRIIKYDFEPSFKSSLTTVCNVRFSNRNNSVNSIE